VKNGYEWKSPDIFFHLNPNLKYICVENNQYDFFKSRVQGSELPLSSVEINSYCSFKPGGTSYEIKCIAKIDSDKNGCDLLDNVYRNMKYDIKEVNITGSVVSDSTESLSIPLKENSYIITPVLENPSYFLVSPINTSVTFPTQTSPFIQDFCFTPNGIHSDLEVTLLPLHPARPGFESKYKIVCKNKGNTTESGNINVNFNDDLLDFIASNSVIATKTLNNLSWNFSNLKPFETREITFTLNVNSPMETPAVNNGDILKFVATLTTQGTDETPLDNTFTLNQTVVGSYDPNDKTCLEGSVITPSLIGEYVHYMIRFENTGTYQAQNIVVKDMIDLSKFDISTLIPTSSSHSFVTKISGGNKVEFIFENINLPFDDANNDGYVAFKIKTLPTLKVGDSFTNEANIYFDYNFPILTNKATSKFETTLNIQDFEFSNYFKIYPVPAVDVLNISMIHDIEIQSIAVYDILGQMAIAFPNIKDTSKIDVSNLKTGNYFLKIKSNKGISSLKFIKK
jgi:hypothetical protein